MPLRYRVAGLCPARPPTARQAVLFGRIEDPMPFKHLLGGLMLIEWSSDMLSKACWTSSSMLTLKTVQQLSVLYSVITKYLNIHEPFPAKQYFL